MFKSCSSAYQPKRAQQCTNFMSTKRTEPDILRNIVTAQHVDSHSDSVARYKGFNELT